MSNTPAPLSPDSLTGLSDQALLALVDAGLNQLRGRVLDAAVDDATLRGSVEALQRCETIAHAEKLRRLAEVEARKAFRAANHRSTPDWFAEIAGLSLPEARRQAATAEALTRLPNTAAALADGAITSGHADTVALRELDRQAKQRRVDAGADADAWNDAVDQAEQIAGEFDKMAAGEAPTIDRMQLRKRIDAWTAANDPDVIVDRDRRALAMRGVHLAQQRNNDGLWCNRLNLTDAAQAQFLASLQPFHRKDSADDERTVAQRLHDGVATVAKIACESGQLPSSSAALHPTVLILRTEDPGTEPAAPEIDGVGPVSHDTAALFECDADTTIVRRDTNGRIWDIGHADGDPSAKQRAAVIARDNRCVGCGAPVARCQVHHIIWRSDNGPTQTSNLVLVCWSCHSGIHHLGWTIQGHSTTGFSINRHPAPAVEPVGAGPPRHTG